MPVIAVGAALYAGATIATVGIAAMSTMAVISAVGTIAAGVGVVTGNKELTQIGAVAGLAGGIGAFAQGQGWLAGDLAKGADAAGGVLDVASEAAGGAEAVSNTGQMIAEATPGVVDPSANLASAPLELPPGAAPEAGFSVADSGSAASSAGSGLMNTPLQLPPGAAPEAGYTVAGAPATSSSIFDTIKGVGDFMGKNKELAAMGLNFVGGMFDDKKKAEATAANAAAGLSEARTGSELLQQNILRQQQANANSVPDLTGLRVNPAVKVFNTEAPPVYRAPRAGLINSTGR